MVEPNNLHLVRLSKGPTFLAISGYAKTVEFVRDGQLQKSYFMCNEYDKYLRNEEKQDILWHVDRTSPQDKIRDFVTRSR